MLKFLLILINNGFLFFVMYKVLGFFLFISKNLYEEWLSSFNVLWKVVNVFKFFLVIN